MSLSFAKIKLPSIPKVSIKQPKIPTQKSIATPNFAKYTKLVKIPKVPKVTILKNAIKKVKNKGY